MKRKTFVITLKRSLIGCTESQRKTALALGLKKLSHTVKVSDSPGARGQIMKLQHLVDVVVEG